MLRSRRRLLLPICLFLLQPVILLCEILGGIRRNISQHWPVSPLFRRFLFGFLLLLFLTFAEQCLPEIPLASSFSVHVVAVPKDGDELESFDRGEKSDHDWGGEAVAVVCVVTEAVLSADLLPWERKTIQAITKKIITPATAPMIAPI
jgi:hypothetical protein